MAAWRRSESIPVPRLDTVSAAWPLLLAAADGQDSVYRAAFLRATFLPAAFLPRVFLVAAFLRAAFLVAVFLRLAMT